MLWSPYTCLVVLPAPKASPAWFDLEASAILIGASFATRTLSILGGSADAFNDLMVRSGLPTATTSCYKKQSLAS